MFIVPQCGVDQDRSYNCDGSFGPIMKHSLIMHLVCVFRMLGRELRDNRYKLSRRLKDFESSPCYSEPTELPQGQL